MEAMIAATVAAENRPMTKEAILTNAYIYRNVILDIQRNNPDMYIKIMLATVGL